MSICSTIYGLVRSKLDVILSLRDKRLLKPDNSYVTEGDILCEKIILDYLKSRPEQFEVISEERPSTDFVYDENKNYVVLDPIDGTENFASGLKEWGISISIYKQGRHFESMLVMPELDLRLLSGDKVRKFKSRVYGLSSSLTREDLLKLPDGFEYRIIGCAVYNIYCAITGSFAVFENPKGAYVWDILAGLNLALENGLDVILNEERYDGRFLQPDRRYRFRLQHK